MGLFLTPLTLFDMQNIATYVPKLNRTVYLTQQKEDDFTILTTTFNSNIPLKNINVLNKYKSHVIICDDGSKNPEFVNYLRDLETEGFRVIRNGHKKYMKWEFLKKIIVCPSREVALTEGLEQVKTKYSLFLDDDTIASEDFSQAVNSMKEKNYDLASVKTHVLNENNFIEKLQAIEYNIAMLGREIRPYLTSGACVIGKTDSLKRIMSNHSMFYNGGDIEIGVIAKRLHMNIAHIDFEVKTEVPNTFYKWFKQRAYWCGGNFRHNIINFWNYLIIDPLHMLYFTGLIWILWYFKIFTTLTSVWYLLPLCILAYIPITYFANFKIRKELNKKIAYLPLYPVYALIQVLMIIPLGFYIYLKQAIMYKNMGIIRLRGESQ